MINSLDVILNEDKEDAICGYMITLACNGIKNPLRDRLLNEFEILLRIIENYESFIQEQNKKMKELLDGK